LESADLIPMGSHHSCSGIFESTQCCSDFHFISDLNHFPKYNCHLKPKDRLLGSKIDVDDRNECLYLSLRFTLAHRFHGIKQFERRVRLVPSNIVRRCCGNKCFNFLMENLKESYRLYEANCGFFHLKIKKKQIRRSQRKI
jgi:hypothetical protein